MDVFFLHEEFGIRIDRVDADTYLHWKFVDVVCTCGQGCPTYTYDIPTRFINYETVTEVMSLCADADGVLGYLLPEEGEER